MPAQAPGSGPPQDFLAKGLLLRLCDAQRHPVWALIVLAPSRRDPARRHDILRGGRLLEKARFLGKPSRGAVTSAVR